MRLPNMSDGARDRGQVYSECVKRNYERQRVGPGTVSGEREQVIGAMMTWKALRGRLLAVALGSGRIVRHAR